MIRICIIIDKHNHLDGFTVKGHAFAGNPGEDIVCSAVSAIAYTALGALLNLAGGCDYAVEEGDMSCRLKGRLSNEEFQSAQIILQTIRIGFLQIQKSYEEFVSVFEEEV